CILHRYPALRIAWQARHGQRTLEQDGVVVQATGGAPSGGELGLELLDRRTPHIDANRHRRALVACLQRSLPGAGVGILHPLYPPCWKTVARLGVTLLPLQPLV